MRPGDRRSISRSARDDRLFVVGGIEPAARALDDALPDLVLLHLAVTVVVGGAESCRRESARVAPRRPALERPPLPIELRVAAVGEDDHQVARGVDEVERLEQLHRLIDPLDDRRAPVVEAAPLARIADQP